MNIEIDKSAKDFLQLADGGVDGNPFPSLNNDGKLLFINDGFVTQFLYITPDELSSTTPIYIGKVSDENEYVAGELVGKNLIHQKIERIGHKNCGMGTFMVDANTIANIEDLLVSYRTG